jgi:hypothetical protein
MALKISVQRFPIALFSILALAPLAVAQTTSSFNAANSGAAPERLTYGVDAGLGETDNVTLATNKISQTIATVDADFDIKHQSSRFDVDAKGNFVDYDYLQGAFGNQLLGRFDGVAHFALVPQRVTWVLQDDFGQAALDPFVPVTPGNIENINYVSTGPDFALRVGGTGFVDASLRVARAMYQTSPFSSNRWLGSLAAGLQLSARSTVSLNGVAERVQFDNTAVNGDFNRSSAYVRYDIEGARTGLSVDLGATKITQNASAGTSTVVLSPTGSAITLPVTIPQSAYSTTGPLARVALTRKLSSAASLTLSGGRELIDGISSFGSIQSGAIGVVGTVPALLTSSSYTSTFGSVGWQYERNRTTIAVSGRWERDAYISQPQFDLTRGGVEINVQRKLSRAFTLQVVGRYYKNDYPNATAAFVTLDGGSPKFDDATVGAILGWRYGRAIEVRLRAEHSSRTTPGADAGFQESRVFLTVGYRPRTQDSNDNLAPSDTAAPGLQR